RYGRRIPLMKNIVEVVGLENDLRDTHTELHGDFESLYSRLYTDSPEADIIRRVERQIETYFGKLELPNYPTLYDLLLLSLRDKDVVFTFNWDPFLFDARKRLEGVAPLPAIYHLHGNLRMGMCIDCGDYGELGDHCSECGRPLTPSRLLFPLEKKN